MDRHVFQFNEKQRELILKMDAPDMIDLFSLTGKNIASFLSAIKIPFRTIKVQRDLFCLSRLPSALKKENEITLAIHNGVLSGLEQTRSASETGSVSLWHPIEDNYRMLGIFISELVHKDPFVFLSLPEQKPKKLTVYELFCKMSLSELGNTEVNEFLQAEVIPPAKERALLKALEKSKKKKKYTVSEVFTRMPLSKVGRLTLSEFFGAEVK